eukprot:2018369-Alexandrium_andersonii.AAC.1
MGCCGCLDPGASVPPGALRGPAGSSAAAPAAPAGAARAARPFAPWRLDASGGRSQPRPPVGGA